MIVFIFALAISHRSAMVTCDRRLVKRAGEHSVGGSCGLDRGSVNSRECGSSTFLYDVLAADPFASDSQHRTAGFNQVYRIARYPCRVLRIHQHQPLSDRVTNSAETPPSVLATPANAPEVRTIPFGLIAQIPCAKSSNVVIVVIGGRKKSRNGPL